MNRSRGGFAVLLAGFALAGCSAASKTPPPSTWTGPSMYDVRLTWPTPSGGAYPLRQSYPSFAHYYPYMAVDYGRYSAFGANFVHPQHGWQAQPGIGYIEDQGIERTRWPDDSR